MQRVFGLALPAAHDVGDDLVLLVGEALGGTRIELHAEPRVGPQGQSIADAAEHVDRCPRTLAVTPVVEAGEQVAVADGPPLAGDYPTSLWQDGDQMRDAHRIALPPDLAPGGAVDIVEYGLPVIFLISPALAFLYNPFTSRSSQTTRGVSTKTST